MSSLSFQIDLLVAKVFLVREEEDLNNALVHAAKFCLFTKRIQQFATVL